MIGRDRTPSGCAAGGRKRESAGFVLTGSDLREPQLAARTPSALAGDEHAGVFAAGDVRYGSS